MLIIDGKNHDLGGGMIVSRILPHLKKRTVGPFVFLDHMGPVMIQAESNTDVRPHPHIGLSTLTYLFEGRIVHHDSSGGYSTIEPGEVNWMTAGRGISHSERAHIDDKNKLRPLHGLQFWIGLPIDKEESEPSFIHYKNDQIPKMIINELSITLIAGSLFGKTSPVQTSSTLIFAEVKSINESILNLSELKFEVAIYIISGFVQVLDQKVSGRQMIYLDIEEYSKIVIGQNSHFVIIGGEPLESNRHLWWNFVSSSKDRIELAKKQWKDGTFPMVEGEIEFIPLPES
jgi:redox-sensitive bicupin YhaK (pirin superfamily)